ncbi:MAG: CHAT domain-containing protein [Thiohalocapsa sp. PB-PSB1]|jgi:hypothetical protein|nr:MAG: CHAT domain-containing protein [Thiohalocapsa sp. PB-PSB1]
MEGFTAETQSAQMGQGECILFSAALRLCGESNFILNECGGTLINLDRLDPALAQLRVIETRLRRFVIAQLHSSESERVRRARLQQESPLQDIVFTLALEHPAEFMGDFYRRWMGAGANADPALALRKTRLNWIGDRDPRRRNPAYWAPFVLVE